MGEKMNYNDAVLEMSDGKYQWFYNGKLYGETCDKNPPAGFPGKVRLISEIRIEGTLSEIEQVHKALCDFVAKPNNTTKEYKIGTGKLVIVKFREEK